jgi:enoyl-CoA hydratase
MLKPSNEFGAEVDVDSVRYEQPEPEIVRLVLDRAERRNAQDLAMLRELDAAFTRVLQSDDVRVVILASEGPDFSSGHDLDGDWSMGSVVPCGGRTPISRRFDAPGAEGWFATEEELFVGYCLRWRDLPVPTVAEVQGRVIAGGLMLTWPCDLIVASEDATFVDPTVAFGVNGHEYFTHLWELGARRAKEMLFTGEPIDAKQAHAIGMVNRVVPREQLQQETLALARRIASRPPFGVRLAKKAINHGLDRQGQRDSIESAFGLHHVAHSHNQLVHGEILDPQGRAIIREEARAAKA